MSTRSQAGRTERNASGDDDGLGDMVTGRNALPGGGLASSGARLNDQPPYDQPPYDQAPYDQAPYDQAPYDQALYDQTPLYETSVATLFAMQ